MSTTASLDRLRRPSTGVVQEMSPMRMSPWVGLSHWFSADRGIRGARGRDVTIERRGRHTEAVRDLSHAAVGVRNLTMRLYTPKSDALTGKWNPPPVTNMLRLMLLRIGISPHKRVKTLSVTDRRSGCRMWCLVFMRRCS
jgi:hypothetical protein